MILAHDPVSGGHGDAGNPGIGNAVAGDPACTAQSDLVATGRSKDRMLGNGL